MRPAQNPSSAVDVLIDAFDRVRHADAARLSAAGGLARSFYGAAATTIVEIGVIDFVVEAGHRAVDIQPGTSRKHCAKRQREYPSDKVSPHGE